MEGETLLLELDHINFETKSAGDTNLLIKWFQEEYGAVVINTTKVHERPINVLFLTQPLDLGSGVSINSIEISDPKPTKLLSERATKIEHIAFTYFNEAGFDIMMKEVKEVFAKENIFRKRTTCGIFKVTKPPFKEGVSRGFKPVFPNTVMIEIRNDKLISSGVATLEFVKKLYPPFRGDLDTIGDVHAGEIIAPLLNQGKREEVRKFLQSGLESFGWQYIVGLFHKLDGIFPTPLNSSPGQYKQDALFWLKLRRNLTPPMIIMFDNVFDTRKIKQICSIDLTDNDEKEVTFAEIIEFVRERDSIKRPVLRHIRESMYCPSLTDLLEERRRQRLEQIGNL